MKRKIAACLLASVSAVSLAACGGGSSQTDENATLVVPEGYTQVATDERIGVNTYGASVEFDPHFL